MLAGRGESRNRISRVEWNLASFPTSVTRKKSPNVYKSCPKMISLEQLNILTPLQNCPRMYEIWAN